MPRRIWTIDAVREMRTMARAGLTAEQIAERMTAALGLPISRQAVKDQVCRRSIRMKVRPGRPKTNPRRSEQKEHRMKSRIAVVGLIVLGGWLAVGAGGPAGSAYAAGAASRPKAERPASMPAPFTLPLHVGDEGQFVTMCDLVSIIDANTSVIRTHSRGDPRLPAFTAELHGQYTHSFRQGEGVNLGGAVFRVTAVTADGNSTAAVMLRVWPAPR